MEHLIRFDLLLTRIAALIAAIAVIAMMLTVAADAFSRQLFNSRIPFVSVIVANYFMVAIAFLPLAMAEAQDRNISVDLIYSTLGTVAQRLVGLIVHVLAFLTCCGLTFTMWDEAMRRYTSGSVAVEDGVSMTIWQGYFLLPAGFSLLAMTYLLRIVLGLANAKQARMPLIQDIAEPVSEAGQ